MKGSKISDYLGEWENLSSWKTYHFFLDEDSVAQLTIKDSKENTSETLDFGIIYRDRDTDQVDIDKMRCDVWEIAENHIILHNPVGFVFKLDRIKLK